MPNNPTERRSPPPLGVDANESKSGFYIHQGYIAINGRTAMDYFITETNGKIQITIPSLAQYLQGRVDGISDVVVARVFSNLTYQEVLGEKLHQSFQIAGAPTVIRFLHTNKKDQVLMEAFGDAVEDLINRKLLELLRSYSNQQLVELLT